MTEGGLSEMSDDPINSSNSLFLEGSITPEVITRVGVRLFPGSPFCLLPLSFLQGSRSPSFH